MGPSEQIQTQSTEVFSLIDAQSNYFEEEAVVQVVPKPSSAQRVELFFHHDRQQKKDGISKPFHSIQQAQLTSGQPCLSLDGSENANHQQSSQAKSTDGKDDNDAEPSPEIPSLRDFSTMQSQDMPVAIGRHNSYDMVMPGRDEQYVVDQNDDPVLFFSGDLISARLWRTRVTMKPHIEPANDRTIYHVKQNQNAFISRMMLAMWNQEGCHDRANSTDRKLFVRNGKGALSQIDLEATCCAIFETLMFRCETGYNGLPKDNLALKTSVEFQSDKTGNCLNRMNEVIDALRTSKCVCRDAVFDDAKITRLVNAPKGYRDTKNEHKRNNLCRSKEKAALLALKIEAENKAAEKTDQQRYKGTGEASVKHAAGQQVTTVNSEPSVQLINEQDLITAAVDLDEVLRNDFPARDSEDPMTSFPKALYEMGNQSQPQPPLQSPYLFHCPDEGSASPPDLHQDNTPELCVQGQDAGSSFPSAPELNLAPLQYYTGPYIESTWSEADLSVPQANDYVLDSLIFDPEANYPNIVSYEPSLPTGFEQLVDHHISAASDTTITDFETITPPTQYVAQPCVQPDVVFLNPGKKRSRTSEPTDARKKQARAKRQKKGENRHVKYDTPDEGPTTWPESNVE